MLRLAYEGMTQNHFSCAGNATLHYNTIQNKQLIKIVLEYFCEYLSVWKLMKSLEIFTFQTCLEKTYTSIGITKFKAIKTYGGILLVD
jgi:hypothetical protein